MNALSITNPLPLYGIAFLPLLFAGYLFAFRICSIITNEKTYRQVYTPVVFISLWIGAIIVSGLISKSFVSALTIGSTLLGICGVVNEFIFHRKKNREITILQSKTVAGSERYMWISALAGSLVVYFIAANGNFHDELLYQGHLEIISQFQNGTFPPKNVLNPAYAFRYHYGFDLLCACLTAVTRCSIDFAIDITTAFSWFYCWVGLWLLGKKLFSFKHAGICTAAFTMLSGGLSPFLGLLSSQTSLETRLIGTFSMKTGLPTNPPIFSYIFQHPFAAGLPICICILLIVVRESVRNKLLVNIILSILFIVLYFFQTVLFITLLPALLFYYVLFRRQYSFIIIVAIIFCIIYLTKSGLLFTPAESYSDSILHFRFWPAHAPLAGITGWYAATFGLAVLFSYFGFKNLNHLKPVFVSIVITAFFIPMFVIYNHTWDIIKFCTVASFYLGILTGGAVAWMLDRSRKLRLVVYVCMPFLLGSAFIHMIVFAYEEFYGQDPYYKNYVSGLSDDYVASINWLRTNAKSDEMILCDKNHSQSFSVYSGLPVVYELSPSYAKAFGIAEGRREDLAEIANFNFSVDDLKTYNIRWVVAGIDDKLRIEKLFALNIFREEKSFGNVKVFFNYYDLPQVK